MTREIRRDPGMPFDLSKATRFDAVASNTPATRAAELRASGKSEAYIDGFLSTYRARTDAADVGTIEKPKPLDFEDHRAALIAKLEKEMRSSDYIASAVDLLEQTWKGLEKQAAEKAGRAAAQDHHEATQSWHEENRTDGGPRESVSQRAFREMNERTHNAWLGGEDTDTRRDQEDDVDPSETAVARARRESDERTRNAWRTKPE